MKSFSSVQSLSHVRLCDPMNRSTPGLPVHRHLPKFTQTHVHQVSDAIQPSHPLSSPSPPAPNPQSTGVSALASFLPKNTQDWSLKEWLDLLAFQGTLKSLLQHLSSKASILQHSAFFTVQLSLEKPYMITGKTIALTRWTFVGKVMSLLLNLCLGWS